jgi:hypothetical protein
LAPGDIRFTLPVIVLEQAEPRREDLVIAFPTLDIALPGVDKVMSYEIRYKKVEWPGLREIYLSGGLKESLNDSGKGTGSQDAGIEKIQEPRRAERKRAIRVGPPETGHRPYPVT